MSAMSLVLHLLRRTLASLILAATGLACAQSPGNTPPDEGGRDLPLQATPMLGDFDAMMTRRVVRVLAPYGRTLFFIDKGVERGVVVELARDFERYLNQKHAKELAKRPLTVLIIATPSDRLFENLNKGLGDIAAGNLTVTPERQKLADFVAPRDRTPIKEIVVTGPASPQLNSLDDLAGRRVYARESSSYHASLLALNERLRAAGKAPVQIQKMPEGLSDDDALEMINAGALDLIVVDDWIAKTWAQMLPKLKLREDLVLRSEGYTGWAIRKNSPLLATAINDFYANVIQKAGGLDKRVLGYNKRIKQYVNNSGSQEMARFAQTVELFRKYAGKYDFDPLMLAAQGFQESRLDQNAKSPVGAIGVMQLMPATGAELGVGDIHVTESNIHAGAKYMDRLLSKDFADAHFSQQDRTLFAFAAYNCGPGNVAKMRREAQRRGLDPNRWFDNVEIVVAEKIGTETTTYVRNIYKYYAAYRLTVQQREEAAKARERMAPGKP